MKSFLMFLLALFFLVGPTRSAYATQHDYVISNDTGANVRADINNALLSIASNNSGLTEPSTTYAYQIWMDTTTGLLKIRNAANSAWLTMGDPALTNLGLMPKTGGAFSGEVTFTNTNDIQIPAGTTAQRNGSPAVGMIRYNSTLGQYESYDASWYPFGDGATQSKTANYTILASDRFVFGDATSGAFTLTYPSAVTYPDKTLCAKKTDSSFNAITLSGTGLTTNYLMTVGETACFRSNGTNWLQVYRITDTGWISHTPTGVWATNTTYSGLWRRTSDGIIMRGSVTLSGAPTGTQSLNIVNSAGWTINTGKLYAAAQNDTLGDLSIFDTGTDNKIGKMGYSSNTAIAFLAQQVSGSNVVRSAVTATVPQTFASGDIIYYETKPIPITNFSP